MLQDLSLQKKLILSMGICVLISLGVGTYIFLNVLTLQKSQERTTDVKAALAEIYTFGNEFDATRQAMAEFLASGNLDKRDEYIESQAEIDAHKDRIIARMRTMGPSAEKAMQNVYDEINTWKTTIVDKQLVYMTSPDTVDLARLYRTSEVTNNLLQSISNHLHGIETEMTAEMDESIKVQTRFMNTTRTVVILGAALTFIATILVSIFLVQTVGKPLVRIVNVTNRLARKEWDVAINGSDRKDEVGQLALALLQFRDNGVENEKLQEQQKLEDSARLKRAQTIESLVAEFRETSTETTDALERATFDMQAASELMSQIAADTMGLSSRVQEAASDTGANVQSVSAATEELTASINEISEQLNRTSRQSADVQNAAENAVAQMKTLEETANSVGNVIQIISDIAEQTNLLALNATIESARAGEAGKGFAVVASEVKTLASETAKATDQVRLQIGSMQSQALEAVRMIDNISKVIEDLTAASSSIAAAMEEQTSATMEISRSVSNAAAGTEDVVRNIGQVNAATAETGNTSDKVRQMSEDLSSRSEKLKSSIRTFIESIKAA